MLKNYRLFCSTESVYKYVTAAVPPSACPAGAGHSLAPGSVCVHNRAVTHPMRAVFGTGADGDVTISTDTTLTHDMHYRNLTVAAGATLRPGGYRIYVAGVLTLAGNISADGPAHNGYTTALGLAAGTIGRSGDGAASTASSGPGNNAPSMTDNLRMGGVGGTGGTSTGTLIFAGGAGGTATQIPAAGGGIQIFNAGRMAMWMRSLSTNQMTGGTGGGSGGSTGSGL